MRSALTRRLYRYRRYSAWTLPSLSHSPKLSARASSLMCGSLVRGSLVCWTSRATPLATPLMQIAHRLCIRRSPGHTVHNAGAVEPAAPLIRL
ncbi:hypothetical protein PSPO01_06068 [Paraphaeosphaeria sporulosa]